MPPDTISKLIWGFVALIIGAVLIGIVASSALLVTETTRVVAESQTITPVGILDINTTEVITLTNAPTGWKATDCPLTSLSITNSSGTAFTVTTDYVPNLATGTFTLNNNSDTVVLTSDNITLLSYNYCGDDYLNLPWGRTVINLVSGFFALAILGIGISLFYSVGKDFNFY